MARSNSPEALKKLGFTLQSVREWREREHEAGRPSELDDFFRAHQICVGCGGHGTLVIGVRWRDVDGVERSEQGPVAVLVQNHGLHEPENWLSEVLKWDYLYETCSCCGGSGEMRESSPPTSMSIAKESSDLSFDPIDELTRGGK